MGTTERRLAKLEAFNKRLMKTMPRDIAKLISEGEIPPQHIGKKTKEVVNQEFTSLTQNFKPQTMSNKEKVDFIEKIENLSENIIQAYETPTKKATDMRLELEKMLGELR